MAGVVGEVLASAVVKVAAGKLAGKLAAAVGEQVCLWRNQERDLNAMKDELDLVQAVLRAAEKRSFTDDAVRRWLQQLKAVAYDISDTLDDGDCLELNDSSSCSCLVMETMMAWMERFKAANKINELKKKLTKIVERRITFGFDLQSRPADEEAILKEVVEARQTMSSIEHGSMIVGRSEEKEKIIGLLQKEEGTTILPIVGIGGMGKTTLAKLVFNDNKMDDFNRRKAWVYVSQKFDLIKIGQNVISELGGDGKKFDNLQSISKCLENMLKDEKFFIVLDDLWEEDVEKLRELKVMLQSGKSQLSMKIIVTTRVKAIAQEMRTHHTFDLKLLSDDECWIVFKQSALPSTVEKDAIGRDIAMKCKGLPLAAHTVGSMLRRKESIEFWKAIRDSDTWNDCDVKVLPSLRLSYDHMPSHLKQCFAYCAIFSKGFIINKDELIQQWIALGFVQPFPSNLSHNAQAEQQVWELLEISFLQNSMFDSSSSSDVSKIAKTPQQLSMHDLVHDLAAWVSGDETLTLDATKKYKGSKERRHVVVVNYDEGRLSKSLPVSVRALHFRGCRGTQLPNNAFSSTRHVRVLDITGCALGKLSNSVPQLAHLRYLYALELQDEELPRWITKLLKLQFFSISYSSKISELPESVGNLKDLVYLNLSGCESLVKLPESVGNLKNLAHLDLSGCENIVKLPESVGNLKDLAHLDLSGCESLVELPESVGNLKDLAHLDLSGCGSLVELPESIGNLKDLAHLDLLWCVDLVQLPKSVGNLKHLAHLNLSGCESLAQLSESVGNLKDLAYLDLSGCERLVELPESVGNLKDLAHLNLSRCESLVQLPESVGNLKDLVHLNLSGCESLEHLPESVGNLKDLAHLNLSGCESLEYLPESVGNLKDLVHLDLSGCESLEYLPESVGNLKDLAHLDLSGCKNLVELPESVGNLKHLAHLDLSRCEILEELPESVGNLKHLAHLDLSRCENLEELPESVGNLKDLAHLDLSECNNLIELPESVGNLKHLAHLDLSRCENLKELPESVGNLKHLAHLDLSRCENLVELPESFQDLRNLENLMLSYCELKQLSKFFRNFNKLRFLSLWECSQLEELPPLGQLPNLKELSLGGMENIKKLGKDFCGGSPAFSKLKKFELRDMKSLEEWSTVVSAFGENEAEFMFPNLEDLHIWNCPMLSFTPCPPRATVCRIWRTCDKVISSCGVEGHLGHSFSTLITELRVDLCDVPEGEWRLLDDLPGLYCLRITRCHKLKNLPTTIQGLSSLQELKVGECNGLVQLPEWLGELASLRTLSVYLCGKLMSLPECIQHLKNRLECLFINGNEHTSGVYKRQTS